MIRKLLVQLCYLQGYKGEDYKLDPLLYDRPLTLEEAGFKRYTPKNERSTPKEVTHADQS